MFKAPPPMWTIFNPRWPPQGVPQAARESLLVKYVAVRRSLMEEGQRVDDQRELGKPATVTPLHLTIPDGLPKEFDAYVRGLAHFNAGRIEAARAAWESILRLPADQRKYREVWAQFMIGKSRLGHDPAKAVAAFQQVRQLVKNGARDPIGLAASSIGWEARAELEQNHEARAVELYFEQSTTGDPTAIQSLQFVCQKAFVSKDAARLAELAKNPLGSRTMTAYALSMGGMFLSRPDAATVKAWLAAVEKAGMDHIVGAERLAWSAYQSGDIAAAQRWVDRAPKDAPLGAMDFRQAPPSRRKNRRCGENAGGGGEGVSRRRILEMRQRNLRTDGTVERSSLPAPPH